MPKPPKHQVVSMKDIGERLRSLRQARDMTHGSDPSELPRDRRLVRRLRQIEQLPKGPGAAKDIDAVLKSPQVA